ncbi:MAG: hypothetical protein H6726_22990 [Sandaracinaceae bacterium]|nr:hypothetical protein [Sandaracinaceae bacterium]
MMSVAAMVVGCGYPTPYTVSRLQRDAQRRPSRALVHYLGQPGADVAVCRPGAPEYSLQAFADDDAEDFNDALLAGRVSPAAYEGCSLAYFSAPDGRALRGWVSAALDVFLRTAPGTSSAEEINATTFRVLAAGPQRIALSDDEMAALVVRRDDARSAGPARERAATLLVSAELERGPYRGQPVTEASLGSVEDEALLLQMRARLPAPAQRRAATERLVAIRIAASDDPHVTGDPTAHARIVATGRNAQAVPREHIERAWFEGAATDFTVVVQQDIARGSSALGALRAGEQHIVPTLDLRPGLRMSVAGFARPLTLCAPADEVSVQPCVDAASLAIASPAARIDAEGTVHFAEALRTVDVIALVSEAGVIPLPIELDHTFLLSVTPRVQIEAPRSLVFDGGPPLVVALRRTPHVWVVDVSGPNGSVVVALPPTETHGFVVVSRGPPGASGTMGHAGTAGSSGMNGMPGGCPNRSGGNGGDGRPGGRGGDGGPGGNGGNGGPIEVRVVCNAASCPEDERLALALVQSVGGQGGQGGQGGAGGRGGRGGSGGSGAYCPGYGRYGEPGYRAASSVSGGRSGSNGMDGARGNTGRRGANGAAGPITLVRVRE